MPERPVAIALEGVGKRFGKAAAVHDVTLSIRDDGVGFDPGNIVSSDGRGLGLGMFGMEERVALVNGRFRVWSSPGQGVEIFSYVPIARS